MGTLHSRAQARNRLRQLLEAELDRLLPADESVPLKGRIFRDFEDQADELKATLLPAFLEERCALDGQSMPQTPGTCPHCGSQSTRFIEEPGQEERLSTAGPVVLPTHQARCRDCGRSFSPSGPGLAPAGGGAPDSQGGRAAGPGGGLPGV